MDIGSENQSAAWNRLALFSIFAVAVLLPAAGHSAPVCAVCHPKETARYLQTGMGNSLLPAAPLTGGQILHGRSGSTIDVAVRNGRMFHNLSERGPSRSAASSPNPGSSRKHPRPKRTW